jgi:hypothetical protein
MEKQGLEGPEELVLPDFPEVFGVVWEKFLDISSSRSVGFQGPLPISYSDMYYWSKITGWKLAPWEIKVIKRLDAVWHKVMKG